MTTPDIQSLVESVLRLDKEATKGPWEHYLMTQDGKEFRYLQSSSMAVGVINTWPLKDPHANANLIAEYRTAAPILATEVLRLRAELAEEKRKVEVATTAFERIAPVTGHADKVVCLHRIANMAAIASQALAALTSPSEKGEAK